jgi:ABC-2 type transport system permease protein
MRQLSVELRRFFARRIVRGAFVLAALLVLVVVGIQAGRGRVERSQFYEYATSPPDAGFTTPEGQPTFDGPTPEIVPIVNDTRLKIGETLETALEGTGVAMLFVAFVLGASFVGAEFNVGSLTTQLLFEPRRWRVHTSKALAVAIGASGVALGVLALLTISMYVGSGLRGVVAGLDATWWSHRVGETLRIVGACGSGAAMAYAVTLVAKRSSAGIIALFLQYPLLFMINPARKPFGFVSHYMPLRGLLAIVVDPARAEGFNERTIHTMAGGLTLTLVWVVVILVVSGRIFSRAEVR